ncbi:MAG: hypothetical protein WCS87_19930, partial [Methylococcaceae bacterium]
VSDSVTRQIEVSINQLIVYFVIAIHGNWIPAIPAGMTDFLVLCELFCCSVSRLKLVAVFLNGSDSGAWERGKLWGLRRGNAGSDAPASTATPPNYATQPRQR